MKDVVYVVNELSDYFKVTYEQKVYIFNADKPVMIDYTKSPRIVSHMLQYVQLRLVVSSEFEKYKLGEYEEVEEVMETKQEIVQEVVLEDDEEEPKPEVEDEVASEEEFYEDKD